MLQKCYEKICKSCINMHGVSGNQIVHPAAGMLTLTDERTNVGACAHAREVSWKLVKLHGSCEAVRELERTFDHVFRKLYDVHGGQRLASWREADGSYNVIMAYSASWVDFPGYKFDAIKQRVDDILNSHWFDWTDGEWNELA